MSNIDIEIGKGNPGAVGIRFHGAQHDYLSHMDFRIGSGLAGIHQVANEAEDLRFFGGRYGILAESVADPGQRELPQPAGRDRDRPRLRRLAVGQEHALREYRQGGGRDQRREERQQPDRVRERRRQQRAGVRALPPRREAAGWLGRLRDAVPLRALPAPPPPGAAFGYFRLSR